MNNLGNKPVMAANIKRYMKLKGVNAKELSKALKVPYTTVLSWTKAEYYPRIDKIEMMSDYFGILKSDLIEEKDEAHFEMHKKNSTLANLTLRMHRDSEFLSIIEMIGQLNPEQLNHIKQSASLLLKTKD